MLELLLDAELELETTELLLGGVLELLLDKELDEDNGTELELGKMMELELELGTKDELLGSALELLLCKELDEDNAAELELDVEKGQKLPNSPPIGQEV